MNVYNDVDSRGLLSKISGVVCNHIGPVNMIDLNGFFHCSSLTKDIVGCSAPVIFDFFVGGFFGSLGCGLSFSLDLKCCDVLVTTPSVAQLLLDDETNINVKKLVVGGEACIQSLENTCKVFYNVYGPTETSFCCTFGSLSSTIGTPLPRVLCYVVHPDDGTLCAPGVSGELWIGGVGVSLGYHNRPELTAEKFIPNPFINSPTNDHHNNNHTSSSRSHLVYKSGDRVKWDANGKLVYLGRFDHQVKVRGYRVELGEIQAELEKHECVGGALAMVHGQNIVAFVVISTSCLSDGHTDVSTSSLKPKHLLSFLESDESSLPSYMVPWKIVVLDKFPLTANGKIDRQRLIIPSMEILPTLLVSPGTMTERFLISMFQDILGTDSFGIDCSFSEIGGHSLHVMRAVLQIRERFEIDSFSPRDFISLSTVRKIGEHIDTIMEDHLRNTKGQGQLPEITIHEINPDEPECGDEIDGTTVLSFMVKPVAVLILWLVVWTSLLPSYIVISHTFDQRFNGNSQDQGYLTYIGTIFAAILMSFMCIIGFTYLFCKILQQKCTVTHTRPMILKQNSLTYALWYIFDRLWFITSNVANSLLGGTIFLSGFYRLFGANIGSGNFFINSSICLPFLISTGDNVAIERGAKIETARVLGSGDVLIGEVKLEDNVVVGPNAHISLDSSIGSSTIVQAISRIPQGSRLSSDVVVEGVTFYDAEENDSLQMEKVIDAASEDKNAPVILHLVALLAMHTPSLLSALYFIGVYVILYQAIPNKDLHIILIVVVIAYPFLRMSGQMVVTSLVIPLRLLLNWGRAKPRCTKLYSTTFVRQWLASQLSQSCTPEDGSIVSRCTQRLLGADIDIHNGFPPQLQEPQLTRTGKNVFCANGVQLCNLSISPGGIARFGTIEIDDSSMILDRSVVDVNCKIESKVMIASLTAVTEKTVHATGSLLIGSPALYMISSTDTFDHDSMEIKNEPMSHSLLIYFISNYVQLVVIAIPILAVFYSNAYIFGRVESAYSIKTSMWVSFICLPLSFLLIVAWMLFFSILAKWVLLGNTKRLNHNNGIMNADSRACFWWKLSNILVHMLCAIPLQVVNEFWLTRIFWKFMGAKVGKGSKIDPDVLLFEGDLLEIGDNCRIEEEATLLCHKFSNGGLELAPVIIPSKTFVGSRAVILPGCKFMDEGICIKPLTHVLPSEELTAGTWHGSPAEKTNVEC
jgi:non-ribosomal peptide synthetase-like protein